jgi:hypothetical protein
MRHSLSWQYPAPRPGHPHGRLWEYCFPHKPGTTDYMECKLFVGMVGVAGFEPAAPCSQSSPWRHGKLSTSRAVSMFIAYCRGLLRTVVSERDARQPRLGHNCGARDPRGARLSGQAGEGRCPRGRRGSHSRNPGTRRLHPGCPAAAATVAPSRTEQDSRRTRGLKSACLTGAFSANQRKQSDPAAAVSTGCFTETLRQGRQGDR